MASNNVIYHVQGRDITLDMLRTLGRILGHLDSRKALEAELADAVDGVRRSGASYWHTAKADLEAQLAFKQRSLRAEGALTDFSTAWGCTADEVEVTAELWGEALSTV
jgi:hypothetical protein